MPRSGRRGLLPGECEGATVPHVSSTRHGIPATPGPSMGLKLSNYAGPPMTLPRCPKARRHGVVAPGDPRYTNRSTGVPGRTRARRRCGSITAWNDATLHPGQDILPPLVDRSRRVPPGRRARMHACARTVRHRSWVGALIHGSVHSGTDCTSVSPGVCQSLEGADHGSTRTPDTPWSGSPPLEGKLPDSRSPGESPG